MPGEGSRQNAISLLTHTESCKKRGSLPVSEIIPISFLVLNSADGKLMVVPLVARPKDL